MKCRNCLYWRQQSGSAHVICPTYIDAPLYNMTPCKLFKEGEPETREINQFLLWSGRLPEDWPTEEEKDAILKGGE